MSGSRLSDLPTAIVLWLRHRDWRGFYTRQTRIDPDRLTDDAKAVLEQADTEVRSRGNEILGTQHLLLGLLRAENATIDVPFAIGGLPREKLVEIIDGHIQPGHVVWDPPEPVEYGEAPVRPRFVGMTRRAMDAEERAFKLADLRGTDRVNANLLLAALVADRRATATRLLRQAGVNIRALKRASLATA